MKKHWRSRRRTRGAAMVEAVVVLPVLITFLGLMLWTSNCYNEKLREQTETRSMALAYGLNACQKKDVATYPDRPGQAVRGGEARLGEATSEGGEGEPGGASAMFKKLGGFVAKAMGFKPDWAEAHATGNVAGATAVNNEKVPLSRTVHGDSYVGCNEVVYDNKLSGLGGVVKGLITGSGR